jgi:hypothetical protein
MPCGKVVRPVAVFTSHHCVALQLQFWLVSSSPGKLGRFSFEYSAQSHETGMPALGGWLVAPPPLPVFVTFPTFVHLGLGSCPTPVLQGRISVPLTPAVSVRLQFTVHAFQFCWGGVQSPQGQH